jgi:hypothetical protein
MAEDRREQPLGIGARQREFVGVADARGLDLDQHFALARPFELDGSYFQRFSGGGGNSGANIHGYSSLLWSVCRSCDVVCHGARRARAISPCRIAYDRALRFRK